MLFNPIEKNIADMKNILQTVGKVQIGAGPKRNHANVHEETQMNRSVQTEPLAKKELGSELQKLYRKFKNCMVYWNKTRSASKLLFITDVIYQFHLKEIKSIHLATSSYIPSCFPR